MKPAAMTAILLRLGLPPDLLAQIRDGRLQQSIARAYAQYDLINERLDAMEVQQPELAARLPWYQARQAWKRAGRPRPDWWDVICWTGFSQRVPINKKQISQELFGEHFRR